MNVARHLAQAAKCGGDRPAVVAAAVERTYAELEDRANRLANAMLKAGLRTGDRVAISSPNRPEFLEIMFACFKAGLALVPAHYRLQHAEVEHVLALSGASLLFQDMRLLQLGRTPPTSPSLKRVVVMDESAGGGDYHDFLGDASSSPIRVDVETDHPAWLFFTSGTTGRPKGATLTHRNLEALALGMLANIDPAESGDVFLHAGPMSHASGLCALHHVARGNTHVILPYGSFDPDHVIATIAARGVTTTFMVPTAINMLLEAAEHRRGNLRTLHTLIYGGAPMPTALLSRALEVFGPVMVQLYGQGEAPHVLTVLSKGEHQAGVMASWPDRLRSAGRACVGVELRIVDGEDRPVPANDVGEIVARGDVVMRGYWNDPASTADALRDGWLHTGDVGYLDDSGYLFITDRKKELIISGGMNVYSREVEEIIHRHPAVQEVAVVGVQDSKWGEAVKAFVVVKPGFVVDADEIIEICREHLASYKNPKSVEFLTELPKGATGKILKRELTARSTIGARS